MGRRKKLFFMIPAGIVGIVLFMALGGWIVMSLWNWLLPSLLGWKLITFWQALALLILCRLLFGGFGGHRSMRRNMGWRMRERMAERWEHMTPEERERFREKMRGHCGHGDPSTEPQTN
jgi:hypothetical protein